MDGEKAQAEAELHLKQQEVQEKEQEMVKLATKLEQLINLQERVNLCEEGRWQEQEELARAAARDKRPLQRFEFCSNLCLLTLHDRSVQKKTCSVCYKTCHTTCQLWDTALVEGEAGPLACLACRPDPITTYSDMKDVVGRKVQEIKDELTMATVKVEQVRSEESYLRGKLAKWVGPLRRRLLQLLEEVLKVVRTAYHGGTYVGAHVEKILKHHEILSTVLDSRPEIKALFNEFCATYLVSHGLMKRAGWLEPHEVFHTALCSSCVNNALHSIGMAVCYTPHFQLDILEENATKLGQLWPKLFVGSSIPPKVDVLIFVVPAFARKWNTVGGLGEQRLEALHQVFNAFDRVLVCQRHKGKTYALAMKRVHAHQVGVRKVGHLSRPRPRKFTKRPRKVYGQD